MAAGGAAILIVAMSVYWATSTVCDDHRNIAGNVSVSRAAFVGRYCDGAKTKDFAEICVGCCSVCAFVGGCSDTGNSA